MSDTCGRLSIFSSCTGAPALPMPCHRCVVPTSRTAVTALTVARGVDKYQLAPVAMASAEPIRATEAHHVGQACNGDCAQVSKLATLRRAVVQMRRRSIVQGDPRPASCLGHQKVDRMAPRLDLLIAEAGRQPCRPPLELRALGSRQSVAGDVVAPQYGLQTIGRERGWRVDQRRSHLGRVATVMVEVHRPITAHSDDVRISNGGFHAQSQRTSESSAADL